ncbi:MAG: GGDEF domain-containing protein [Sphingomonadaceae bacterium]
MNGKHVASTLLVVGLLALWMVATAVVFAQQDLRDMAILGWALAAAVVATALANPFRWSGIAAMVVGVAIYVGAQIHRTVVLLYSPLEPRSLLAFLPGSACLAVAALLGMVISRQMTAIRTQLERDAETIAELSRHDVLTGALKSSYADRLLNIEIERARRYQRPLSLLLLSADDWEDIVRDQGPDATTEILATAGKILMERLRTIDVVVRGNESNFLAILPETGAEGAQVVAERLCNAVTEGTGIRYRAGIAEFPNDGASREELVAEAEAALQFARQAGITVASHSLLR